MESHRSSRTPRVRLLPALGAALVILSCEKPPPPLTEQIHSSIAHGLACVARAYDGNSFDDKYLRFVYAGENLQSPLPGYRVTYRLLDAYFIVLMIGRAGIEPGDGQSLFDRAEALTAALAIEWRSRGIYNLRDKPDPTGLALDSYSILAILRQDTGMARIVEAGLDGDGWLAADFYTGEESFRRLADESWATRALLLVSPEEGTRMVRILSDETIQALQSEKDPLARANLVIHALLALGELPARKDALVTEPLFPAKDLRAPLRQQALVLLQDPAILKDTLTLANLVGVLLSDAALPDGALSPHIRELLRRQDGDGCWSVSLDSGDSSGRVFATLRLILALGDYDRMRLKRPEGA
ncbi:MAG: hypothetical protein L0170_08485 [Acidobacteria bacterium]|nr:hypothetical protein [Acidobacteriota bacterium]